MAKSKSPNEHVDEYIDSAASFAKPICHKLRKIIFKAEPTMIEEWKWGPNYQKNGMVCGFGHFKNHVHLSFFQGALLKDPKKMLTEGKANLHNRGVKFRSVEEIDEKTLIAYIREAVANNKKGTKVSLKERKDVNIPSDFLKALKSGKLDKKFESLAFSYRKDYVNWIESAKKEETRNSRIKKALEKISKGIKFHETL